MKSSQPSLRETRDKQPLGRDRDRSWYHCHTTSMIKLFLVTANGSMGIGGSIRARRKVFGLAYNRRETQDKRPLGRNSDRRWYHRHTNVNISMGCNQKSFTVVWK